MLNRHGAVKWWNRALGGGEFFFDHGVVLGMGDEHEFEHLIQREGLAVGFLERFLEFGAGRSRAIESEASGGSGRPAKFIADVEQTFNGVARDSGLRGVGTEGLEFCATEGAQSLMVLPHFLAQELVTHLA